jgi:NAD kinase
MLTPEVAAKFSHYYSVDNGNILLFDPKPVPGFGGNHLPTDSIQYSSYSSLEDNYEMFNMSDGPDLICTLGGDGLLMHAR